jgi:hypothetical protein
MKKRHLTLVPKSPRTQPIKTSKAPSRPKLAPMRVPSGQIPFNLDALMPAKESK